MEMVVMSDKIQMRLDKFLSEQKMASRSQLKVLLKKGVVSVNGQIEKDGSVKINTQEDIITFQGQVVGNEIYEYYMFHKPAGCVTATKDNFHKTVLDYFLEADTKRKEELVPAGRLDKDTEGLLLMTNDGALVHDLLSPRKHVSKTYLARLDAPLHNYEEVKNFMEQGLDIGDEKQTLPAILEERNQEEAEYLLTITEGRFHQVKRMFQAVDREVVYLKRLTFGTLVLDEALEPGKYRRLTEEEIRKLKQR